MSSFVMMKNEHWKLLRRSCWKCDKSLPCNVHTCSFQQCNEELFETWFCVIIMGGGWRPNLQLTGWRRFEQVLLVWVGWDPWRWNAAAAEVVVASYHQSGGGSLEVRTRKASQATVSPLHWAPGMGGRSWTGNNYFGKNFGKMWSDMFSIVFWHWICVIRELLVVTGIGAVTIFCLLGRHSRKPHLRVQTWGQTGNDWRRQIVLQRIEH